MSYEDVGRVVTDLKDFISGSSFELVQPNFTGIDHFDNMYSGTYGSTRLKVKEGLSFFNLFEGDDSIVAAVAGGETHYSPSGSFSCGEYVTLYFRRFTSDHYIPLGLASRILEQVDEMIDPFPDFVTIGFDASYDNFIPLLLNEDFTAPSGIFSNPDQEIFAKLDSYYTVKSFFSGSEVTTGPRIYSDYAMKQMFSFGVARSEYSSIKVFEDCPNLETIRNQGEFGEMLQILYPIDLTYRDGMGIDRVSAYPSGGAPKYIFGYVVGERLSFSDSYPVFDTSELVKVYDHIKCDTMVLDGGIPSLPVGGLSFKNSDKLKYLSMPELNWEVELQAPTEFALNFSFSWGTLGVESPPSPLLLSGLHSIWMNVEQRGGFIIDDDGHGEFIEAEHYILTPNRLDEAVSRGWGEALQNTLDEGLEVTDDYMPLVPTGVETMRGYYHKKTIGVEQDLDVPVSMDSFRQRPFLDTENRYYEVQPLSMGVGQKFLLDYVSYLYSDMEIDFDITIPAMPSGLSYVSNAYARTFLNAVGPSQPIDLDMQPVVTVVFSRSEEGPYTINNGIIPNLTKSYSGVFRNYFESRFGPRSAYHREISISKLVGRLHVSSQYNPTYWEESSEEISFGFLDEFIDYMYSHVELMYLTMSRIESEIVLERDTISSPSQVYNFQRDCFFGAAINPESVDALIPLSAGTVIDEESYSGSLNIFTGASSGVLNATAWTPKLRGRSPMLGGITTTYGDRHDPDDPAYEDITLFTFFAILSWTGGDSSEYEDYRYKLDEIIWNGSPRHESIDVIEPYQKVLSNRTIKGDQEEFMEDKGIYLWNDESFNATSEGVDTEGSFKSTLIGFNAYRDTDISHDILQNQEMIRFIVSANETILVGPGISDEYLGWTPFYNLYQPPEELGVDSLDWKRSQGWITAVAASEQESDDEYFGLDDFWGSSYIAGLINSGYHV